MNQFEIKSFLEQRDCENMDKILTDLQNDPNMEIISYRNYQTYRFK